MKGFRFLFLSVVMVIASSCNRDEVITTQPLPEIIIEGDGIYSVTVGQEVRLAPEYKNAEDATFEWRIGEDVVGTERAYVYTATEVGEVYISITVTNTSGSSSEEMRIDVLPEEHDTPIIDIALQDMTVAVGFQQIITANVRATEDDVTISWSVNGEAKGEGESYEFIGDVVGIYEIVATATNHHGSAEDSVTITVVEPSELSLIYEFNKNEYHITEGRNLLISPSNLNKNEGVTYLWTLDGNATEWAKSYYIFNSSEQGMHTLGVSAETTINGTPIVVSHTFTIEVIEAGKYYRERTAQSIHIVSEVLEYTPAPGQFIGETRTGGFSGEELTAEDAVAYAIERLHNDMWVSLGAFGGYIVAKFDHSVDNNTGADIAILGNSFDGSSEPGIVWVMQDENGNGLADDTWYELRGSETGQSSTYVNYKVTYYRPSGACMPVAWVDNRGGSGTIDYLQSFHNQPYYYPTWITEDSYTLCGTRLEARNYDASGNGSMWIQPAYGWGYADNYSSVDCTNAANNIDIANAMDALGNPITLDYIDFVKVQSGVQAKSGWLGELSTEVCSIYELME